MAQIKKRAKRRNPLGPPPKPTETLGNLQEPEVAPADTPQKLIKKRSAKKVDGRTLRRTDRTEQFTTRVHPEFKKELHRIAQKTGKAYNALLEDYQEAYKKYELKE